jgi:hypothetical protein
MPPEPLPSQGRKRVVLTTKEAAEGFGRALAENTNNLLADGKLAAHEAAALKRWLEACGETDLPAFNYLREEIQRFAADGRILPWELARLQLALERILPPKDRAIAKAARKKAEAELEAREAIESEASLETRLLDSAKRRAHATDDNATAAQLKFIGELGGTVSNDLTKHEASEEIGRLLAEREESEETSNTANPPVPENARDAKLMKAIAGHEKRSGQQEFEVSLPTRQPYEGKATLKQKDLIWSLGFRDQAVIDSLGKWQASALIDQMKAQRKTTNPALIFLILIAVVVVLLTILSK